MFTNFYRIENMLELRMQYAIYGNKEFEYIREHIRMITILHS